MNEETLATRRVFDGLLIKVDELEVRLESGRCSRREIVRHPGAVGVLGRLPDDRFVFVRQFRKPIERELLEIVAGTLDPGEAPEACGRREMKEETGYEVDTMRHLGRLHMAPGFCDERIDLFFAELRDRRGAQDTDQDENLEVVILARSEIERMIECGELEDGKTMVAWLMAHTRGVFYNE